MNIFAIAALLAISSVSQATDIVPIVTTKTVELELDSRSPRSSEYVDLHALRQDEPEACKTEGVSCIQRSKITVTVENMWLPVSAEALTDPGFETETFSEYYPDISTETILGPGSDPGQVILAQKILYDEGYLPVAPTGKYGYLTEKAIIQFQKNYGIYEYDYERGIAVGGPDTIDALNDIKNDVPIERSGDEQYGPNMLDIRDEQINEIIDTKTYPPSAFKKITDPIIIEDSAPDVDLDGEIRLTK